MSLRTTRRSVITPLAALLLIGLAAMALVVGFPSVRAATPAAAAGPGTAYVWGVNSDGELGTASTETCSGYLCSTTPLPLAALPNVTAVAGGYLHSLAATADGSVYAWGSDESGQLGVAVQQTCYGQPCSPVPVQVTGMPAVTAVAAGGHHSLALTSTGGVYAWGGNYDGELGIGSTTNAAIPTPVSGLPTNVIALAAGGEDSLALTADGLVYAWGSNQSGQLGAATTATCGGTPCSTTPVLVGGLSGVTAIAEGAGYSLALTNVGTVYAWGDNTYGTLGNGSTTSSATPLPVAQLANATAIAAGQSALALTNGGVVYAWGDNMYGQLGVTSTSQTCGNGYACSTTPVQVGGLPAGVTAVAAGGGYSLALAGDGTLWTWGDDTFGELGVGGSDSNPHPTPVQVGGLSGVGAIAAGSHHVLVVAPAAGGPTPTPTATPPAAPAATLSTTFIAFGDQQVGTTSAPAPVTLSNTGTAPLTVTGVALSGANAGDYILAGGSCVSASGGTGVQIAPGDSCTMSVSFQPTAAGTRTGTLTVSCDAANCPLSGSVTGTATNPSGSVSPTAISFPDTYVGASSPSPVLLLVCDSGAPGTTDLVVSGVSVGGANPNDFGYAVSGTLPVTVHAGDCLTVNTTFTPSAAGARSATLAFTTNDSLHSLSATLSGNGLLPADLAVTLSASPNPVKSGSRLTYTIAVNNNGAGVANGVTLSDAVPSGTTFSSVATTQGTCTAPPVGGTGTVSCSVSGLPSGATFTVTLVVTVNAPNKSTVADTASVSASTQDPTTANNSASVTTSVAPH